MARLHTFLAARNGGAARRAIRTIRQGVKALAVHPEIGRPVDEVPPEFREWFIRFGDSGYVVIYRYDGALVVVLAVRHGREAGY
jgi:plasmid stabilization system protein ParE